NHVNRARCIFQAGLPVKITALGFKHPQVSDDPGRADVLILTGGRFHRSDIGRAQYPQALELVAIAVERMPADEEAENFLFARQPCVLVPIGNIWKSLLVGVHFLLLENSKQSMLA